ncbi:hypothetical protein [Klebsiella pasteurii]|uniref:hypothetical protein n=1 Tax=Klebsiella pasteurii TaxID=2587529 RepID=UPI00292E7015|nr:hypothetical protein [Klebsiella pasteurii]
MSENNYGALMMKSALSASDDIDTLLLPGIYFVPVGNVTSPHPDGGVLTIYSGSIVHRSFVSDALMFASSTYNSSSQKWSPWAYPVSRDDLNSSIDGLGGDLVSANEYFSVRHVLSRIRTLEDIGISRPSLGYDPINDKILYKAMQGMDDQELLLAGGIHISKKFRGIRRNNTLLGLRGGLTGTSGAFNDQVGGISNSLDLAKYGTHDGVSHFMDATLPPLEEWETVAGVVSYSANSVVVDTVTYSDLLSNLLKGDILKTMHSTPCWALVESIDKETGVITVKPWATSAAYVTPSGTTGFYANKIDKAWSFNANVIIPEDAAGSYAVIGELGAQIKKAGLGYVNGLDVTILPGSIADGTAAYLARSSVANRTWTYGFRSEGSRFGFYSVSGKVQPYSGFTERSNAVVGMRFHNQNTYSMVWGTGAVDSVAPVDSPTIFGPNGQVYRQPKRVLVLTESAIIGSMFTDFIVKTAGITITMPPIANLPVAGYEFVLDIILAGTYYIQAYNNETPVSGFNKYTLVTNTDRKKYTVLWDGTYWQLLEG